jgi:hypothetical protein
MRKYIKNFVFFIISSIVITLVLSSSVQGSNNVMSIDKEVYLTDKAIEKEVVIYNFFNDTVEFTINLYTSPFKSEVLEKNFVLSANESKTIKYIIHPLQDSLKEVYSASIEVVSNNNTFIEYFSITQEFNKKCDVDVNITHTHLEDDNYLLNINFYNSTNEEKFVVLSKVSEIKDFKEKVISIDSNSKYDYTINFNTKNKDIDIEYICNNLLITEKIELQKDLNFKKITGFLSLKDIGDFINSIYFKIILVILLVLVVISFSTRYIKYINKH